MQKLIDVTNPIIQNVLSILLQDKTTGKNIIWATDAYQGIDEKSEMTVNQIMNNPGIICPRVLKSKEEQIARSRKKAEVFTPAWLVNKMNNFIDEDWFGRKNVFNVENSDNTWTTNEDCIKFKDDTDGEDYIRSRRLEITCGEAPYLVSRYDAVGGNFILTKDRVGILDRKMKIVNQNTTDISDWKIWAFRAFKSVYGYEYQGDNTLIARINLLMSFVEYYEEKFGIQSSLDMIEDIASVIAKNIWQMDGLTNNKPLGAPYKQYIQQSLFDYNGQDAVDIPSKIFDYKENKYIYFSELKEMKSVGKKLFDYVIGNPPYNEDFENSGDNGNFAKPVYNDFIDAARSVADKVELVHPARFLFNAGSTPKPWNEKMLNDPHFKVLTYEADSSKFFPNTDIKGGVVISYSDSNKDFGVIGTFTAFDELNSILKKINIKDERSSLMSIIYLQLRFNLNRLYEDYPELKNIIGSGGKDKRLRNNTFEKIFLFSDISTNDSDIKVLGVSNNKRIYKYIPAKYIDTEHENLMKYKVFIPAANGSGAIGEVLSTPLIGTPLIGTTQTFISVGAFDTEEEATACLKYIKTKFARTMLGTLKITQHNPPATWRNVPLQDFTQNSDIDWTKSVAEIDRMLYKKYGLSEEEIEFIETHVKEMM